MKSLPVIAACALLIASGAQAQRPKSESKVVPPSLRPPAGMCRIWLDGVPASRQPAPTDCASALRNRPAKGQVLFGDDYAHGDSADRTGDLPLRGLAPLPKSMEPKDGDSTHADHRADDAGKKKPDAHKPANHKPDSTTVNDPGSVDFPR